MDAAKTQVFYDGACRFCVKSVGLLKKLDWHSRLDYVDMRQSDHPALAHFPVASNEMFDQMHVLSPDRRLTHGFDAMRGLAWLLPPLWLMAPLLYLPGVLSLGRRLYLWVARNRFRLVPCHGGVCAIKSRG